MQTQTDCLFAKWQDHIWESWTKICPMQKYLKKTIEKEERERELVFVCLREGEKERENIENI